MMDLIEQLGKQSTALISQKGDTSKLYKTDASQLAKRQSEITQIPESVLSSSSSMNESMTSSSSSSNASSSSSKASSKKTK